MNWAIVDEAANTVKSNVEDVDLTVFRRWGVDKRFVEVVPVGDESVAVESDGGLIGSALLVDDSIVGSFVENELFEKESVEWVVPYHTHWVLCDEESVLESCNVES